VSLVLLVTPWSNERRDESRGVRISRPKIEELAL
jgi:hypothetical protein